MAIIEIIYPAKCKDCKFIEVKFFRKMKRHICTNPESERYDHNPFLSRVALRDKACDKFKL